MRHLKTISWIGPLLVTVTIVLSACRTNESTRYVFRSPDEAIAEYHKMLAGLRNIGDADIRQLTEVVKTWMELQDSVHNYLVNDSTIQLNSQITTAYFLIGDSIGDEIERLAMSKPRSLQDVAYLMINTAHDREKTISSQNYKSAYDLFAEMDLVQVYPDASCATEAYLNLLGSTAAFTTERDVVIYMKEEDRCFRSLMIHLAEVDEGTLAYITAETTSLFDELYSRVSADSQNPVSERVRLYLAMRFNRRLLQNAEACMNDIKARKELSQQQRDNYRWMLIQPFLAIDSYNMALLTDGQENLLASLAEELPTLMVNLDGTEDRPDDQQKIAEILSDFFLSSYLKSFL